MYGILKKKNDDDGTVAYIHYQDYFSLSPIVTLDALFFYFKTKYYYFQQFFNTHHVQGPVVTKIVVKKKLFFLLNLLLRFFKIMGVPSYLVQ